MLVSDMIVEGPDVRSLAEKNGRPLIVVDWKLLTTLETGKKKNKKKKPKQSVDSVDSVDD